MIKKLRRLIIKLLESNSSTHLALRLYALKKQYLETQGWDLSVIKKSSIDKNGQEIPWFTYSSIHFLRDRIKRDHSIFEYGSGNSTVWFSQKAKSVISVEHDKKWYLNVKQKIENIENVSYHFRGLHSGDYETEILNFKNEFEIIVIDGRNRVECCFNALNALSKDGVVIWDNSYRKQYQEGYDFLMSNGFKRLDFWGMAPISTYKLCTSVFYRETNCLSI